MKIIEKIKNIKLPSVETLKRAFFRALWAFILGGASGFAMTPIDFSDPKKYGTVLIVAVITGGLMGLQKYISGYIKYDK